MLKRPRFAGLRRQAADVLLFGVTVVELGILVHLTPTFGIADWIYVSQHLIVLGVALTRGPARARDGSVASSAIVAVAYVYPYAQVAWLRWVPGEEIWPGGGLVIVTVAAVLSLASLLALGRRFGVRPAWRGLATAGPYRLVRHPMYLAYLLADVGYNLQEGNAGTALLTAAGWASLVWRIRAEERVLAADPGWASYARSVRYRLLPGLW